MSAPPRRATQGARRSARTWWLVYTACAAGAFAALAWISALVLRLERSELAAQASAVHAESVRLALWRMDSWLAPHLAREAARPWFEYRPFHAQERSYTRLLNRIEPGEVLTPSPLLTGRFDFFRLHFQVDADGAWSSPTVPTGNLRDLAEASVVALDTLERSRVALEHLAATVSVADLRRQVGISESGIERILLQAQGCSVETDTRASVKLVLPTQEQDLSWRVQTLQNANAYQPPDANWMQPPEGMASDAPGDAQQAGSTHSDGVADAAAPGVTVGTLVPLWLPGPEPELAFLRRVTVGGEELLQGFVLDWPLVRRTLEEHVADLLPAAALAPALDAPAPQKLALAADAPADAGRPPHDASAAPMDADGTGGASSASPGGTRRAQTPADRSAPRASGPPRLATIPVTLAAPCPEPVLAAGLTPARGTLLTAWIAALAALLAVGQTLRSSIAWGEQRSRFASAVTHELRTPLTTFRMYSEMLATGMVRDEPTRAEYLATLQRESDRLAHLVENVLVYARLEDGRRPLRREPTTAGAVLDRVLPALERRCAEAGVLLEVEAIEPGRASALTTDADTVGQILFNLVDNACKYGRDDADPRVVLSVEREEACVVLAVRDHGPGVAPEKARAIFAAFDRGGRDPSDPSPGIGLGLALSRALARDLGGELALVSDDAGERGARFTLRLPA